MIFFYFVSNAMFMSNPFKLFHILLSALSLNIAKQTQIKYFWIRQYPYNSHIFRVMIYTI